jgi:hypothetical protein
MNDKLMQVLVFAICVAGYVPLAMTGKATAEYVTLIGPVLAVVILKTHLGQQDETLTKIQEQTNGVLDRRIKDGVKAALAEREGNVTD